MKGNQLYDINLLPDFEKQSRLASIIFLTTLILLIIGYALFIFYYVQTKNTLQAKDEEYAELKEQEEELASELQALETAENTSEFNDAVLFAENLNIPVSGLIVELVDILPEHSSLVSYSYNNRVASLVAHFESLDEAANYSTNLLKSNLLTDATVDQISTFQLKPDESLEPGERDFLRLPRYEASYTLAINKNTLQEAQRRHE